MNRIIKEDELMQAMGERKVGDIGKVLVYKDKIEIT